MKQYQLEKHWSAIVLKYPLIVILSSVITVLLLAYGARYVTVSSDYRYFFGQDNPQRQAFESLQNVYSKDDSVLMTISPRDGRVFSPNTLAGIRFLTEQAWVLPFTTRVDSISNFQYSHASGDDFIVQDLVREQDLTLDDEHLSRLEAIALAEPMLKDLLINTQASVTGINIKMTFPGKSPFEVPQAAEAARQLAQQFMEKYPGHEVHLSGMVMLNDAFNEAGIRDVITLMPLMYLLIALMLFFFLRNIKATLSTLSVIVLAIVAGVGFSGWALIPITPPSSIAPTVIMTLAIANSIHILKTLLKAMGRGVEKSQAIIESLKQNLRPVFLTSLTTIIGFLSLNYSDTPPFHDLGNITAVGVAAAFIMSVGFLPALMSLLAIKVKPVTESSRPALASRYAAWLDRRGSVIILVMVFVTVLLGLQINNIKINDQFVGYFDDSIQFRPDSEYTIDKLTGIYQLNFDLGAGESQGITKPAYLEKLDEFAGYMRAIPDVVHVSTLSDTFKRLNKNMHGDTPEYYRLPENRELAAQYLLLYEMSLPYGLDLNNQINVSKSSSRVIVTLGEVPTSRILAISAQASQWLQQHAPTYMQAEATSPTVMFSHITERNIQAMLWGTLIALSLITLIMIVALRSVKYGLLSLLPNGIPATLAIGAWSVLVGEAGFSIAFVASVTLGIIIDDTVHFLSKFNYARNQGQDTSACVRYALEHVGGALITTSIILVLGFSVLMLSGFKLNFVLGALSALTIAIALLVDFTLLPAILRLTDKLTIRSEAAMKLKYAKYTGIAVICAITLSLSFNANANTNMSITSPDVDNNIRNIENNPENKGKWVAVSADNFDSGFENQIAKVRMVLKNPQGQTSERQLRIKILEVNNDGDKSLTIFDTPRDVKGTAFLSYSHSHDPDDQWLYLPSLKRVKRIASNNKSGPFMGSEFAYEDLSSQEVDKYTYKYLRAEEVLGAAGHVIERIPVDPKSGYARQQVWIDATHWRTQKIVFYDRKNELLKTLTYNGYRRYGNNKWRADTMVMENHQSGKSTTLHWSDIAFGVGISVRDFDQNTLKRIR